jgi:hypothetical protein
MVLDHGKFTTLTKEEMVKRKEEVIPTNWEEYMSFRYNKIAKGRHQEQVEKFYKSYMG